MWDVRGEDGVENKSSISLEEIITDSNYSRFSEKVNIKTNKIAVNDDFIYTLSFSWSMIVYYFSRIADKIDMYPLIQPEPIRTRIYPIRN